MPKKTMSKCFVTNTCDHLLRFQEAVTKVGQAGGKMLMDVLTNVAAEVVKKMLGLGTPSE